MIWFGLALFLMWLGCALSEWDIGWWNAFLDRLERRLGDNS